MKKLISDYEDEKVDALIRKAVKRGGRKYKCTR